MTDHVPVSEKEDSLPDPFTTCPQCSEQGYHRLVGDRRVDVEVPKFEVMAWGRDVPLRSEPGGKQTFRVIDRECRACGHAWAQKVAPMDDTHPEEETRG